MTQQTFLAARSPIVATQIQGDAERLNALPKFFGYRFMVRAEATVYQWMSALCNGYEGGSWNFFELSNGGFYMAPAVDRAFTVSVPGNYFEDDMSADATGIVTTLFALGQLAQTTRQAHFATLHADLSDFASDHPEATKIRAALD